MKMGKKKILAVLSLGPSEIEKLSSEEFKTRLEDHPLLENLLEGRVDPSSGLHEVMTIKTFTFINRRCKGQVASCSKGFFKRPVRTTGKQSLENLRTHRRISFK